MRTMRLTALVALVAGPAPVHAQSGDTLALLQEAIHARIAVSHNQRTDEDVPALHCRRAPEGCNARIRAFAEYIASAAKEHDVDPWLLAAIAFRESGFDPFARGSAGEMGLFQIHPKSPWGQRIRFVLDDRYRKRCKREPGACQREIAMNAAQLLSKTTAECGSIVDALGAYNTGRCGGNDSYARRVLRERARLRARVGLQSRTVEHDDDVLARVQSPMLKSSARLPYAG